MGLAQGGAATTITLDANASATTDIYIGETIRITSGVGDDQIRTITAYDGATKIATVDRAWATNPTSASYFAILQEGNVHMASVAANAIDQILDDTIGDGTLTVRQALRVLVAAVSAKLSGAATTTVTIRNVADTQNVVVATVDADGNRTATTVTP
jgi:hypothetical protein